MGGKTYVVIVDSDGFKGLVEALRYHFVTYGAAEEFAVDGGSEYMAAETDTGFSEKVAS